MALTTWDGHARVDYVPDVRTLLVALSTEEPTIEADLSARLRAGFVTDDETGPPAFLAVVLTSGTLPDDLRELLGSRLADTADEVLTGPTRGRWTRLGLTEVSQLASAWAPYRAWVLSLVEQPAPRRSVAAAVGSWATDLWARLSVDELRAAISRIADAAEVRSVFDDPLFFDDEPSESAVPEAVSGSWSLPARLAEAAGIDPRLEWTSTGAGVTVTARPLPGAPESELFVAFDEVGQTWRPLLATSEGTLTATIVTLHVAQDLPAIRIRTRRRPE